MIPSHNGNVMCGQNNYLGTVTSHKMNESEMGYRGSKSVLDSNIVKEQRVDGSWSIKAITKKSALKVYSNGFRKKLSNQNPL